MPHNKRMQLAARGFWFAIVAAGGRPSQRRQLRGGPPVGVWSVHGGRQLMRHPLAGRRRDFEIATNLSREMLVKFPVTRN